jgi:hypothetical protein
MEKKVNRNEKLLYIQTYIVPTKQKDKNPIGNGKNPACNILAGGGLGLLWGQPLRKLRYRTMYLYIEDSNWGYQFSREGLVLVIWC